MSLLVTTAPPCKHCYASDDLVSEIFDNMHLGHSAVVLGHRYNGKQVLIQELRKRLADAGFAVEIISCVKLAATGKPVENVFPSLCEKHRNRKEWVLIVSEIDALPVTSTRWLLEQIRSKADQGQIKALVTGQFDLREMIHGPKSELTNFDHYLAQGLSRERSARFAADLLQEFGLPPDPNNDAQRTIWRLGGGNTFLMRATLWATLEHRNRTTHASGPATAAEIQKSVDLFAFESCAYVVETANRLMESDPDCWPRLEALIAYNSAPVTPSVRLGGALTLSGVAIRDGDRLYWSSELMKRLIVNRFSAVRIADLYARAGRWEEAFSRYRAISHEPKVRPHNRDDRSDVVAGVDALSASLYELASKGGGADEVRKRFAEGCRWLLGFPDVHFWTRNGNWSFDDLNSSPLSTEAQSAAVEILPAGKRQEPTPLRFPSPWTHFAVGAMLETVRSEQSGAVLIGDFLCREQLTRERRDIVEKLLNHFMAAHSHAVTAERAKYRLETRNRHTAIVNSILDAMGAHVLDVDPVIQQAAASLKQLGYREVRFYLIDSERKRIRAVQDEGTKSDPEEIDYVDFSPDPHSHSHVILTGQAVRDSGVAIVPIKKYAPEQVDAPGRVIGTVRVERSDGHTPSHEEVADLELFARQLATAIRYGERVQLIQSTLDSIPDPVLIFDAQRRMRYANLAASALFQVTPRWQAPLPLPSEVDQFAAEALRHRTHFHHVNEISGREYKGDLNGARIENWRGDCA